MESLGKSTDKEVMSFMDQWKKHPMSIPIIILLVTSTFMLVLIQGEIDKDKIKIAIIFCLFSFLLFSMVVFVLVRHKFVFYNATELIRSEVNRQLVEIQESLAEVEIQFGSSVDYLRAAPISKEVTIQVQNFEFLSGIVNKIGYKPQISDSTKKALAKYYYRKEQYSRSLSWIKQVQDKKDSEYNFIRGILFGVQKKYESSRKAFDKSSNPNSLYYKFLSYVIPENVTKKEIDLFIEEVGKEDGPLTTHFFAQLHISEAYKKKALLFPKDDQIIDSKLLKCAFKNAERVFNLDTKNTGFAHYNAACFLSLMGKYNVDIDTKKANEVKNYCDKIIAYLLEAIEQNDKLVKLAARDEDLDWVKSNCGDRFFEIIGKNCARCKSH